MIAHQWWPGKVFPRRRFGVETLRAPSLPLVTPPLGFPRYRAPEGALKRGGKRHTRRETEGGSRGQRRSRRATDGARAFRAPFGVFAVPFLFPRTLLIAHQWWPRDAWDTAHHRGEQRDTEAYTMQGNRRLVQIFGVRWRTPKRTLRDWGVPLRGRSWISWTS